MSARYRLSSALFFGALSVVGLARVSNAAATTGLTTPYLSSAYSPLNTASPGYHLENFESGTFSDPGVTLNSLNGYSIGLGNSVDADDGVIDGSGANGHSLYVVTSAGYSEASFTFNSGILGGYPESAAVALTYRLQAPTR